MCIKVREEERIFPPFIHFYFYVTPNKPRFDGAPPRLHPISVVAFDDVRWFKVLRMKFLFCKNIMKTRSHMRERRSIPKYLIITTFQRIKILTQERTRYFFFSFLLLFFVAKRWLEETRFKQITRFFFLFLPAVCLSFYDKCVYFEIITSSL